MTRVCFFDSNRICIEQNTPSTSIDRCQICVEIRKAKALENLGYALNRLGNIECSLNKLAKAIKDLKEKAI